MGLFRTASLIWIQKDIDRLEFLHKLLEKNNERLFRYLFNFERKEK